jgi:alkanesulfonate monooxygenase SsuD/methylene tetrahydromethanopterin reductase-like flavin-dependent oxidoreductase (luciferase family)
VTLSPPRASRNPGLWLSGSSAAALRRAGRLGDGWLGSFVSAADFVSQRDDIRAAAAEAGRSLGDDRFGLVLWAVASAEDKARITEFLSARHAWDQIRPDDTIGVGADGTRSMLERFRDAGVARVVLMAAHEHIDAFLRELAGAAVVPVEED